MLKKIFFTIIICVIIGIVYFVTNRNDERDILIKEQYETIRLLTLENEMLKNRLDLVEASFEKKIKNNPRISKIKEKTVNLPQDDDYRYLIDEMQELETVIDTAVNYPNRTGNELIESLKFKINNL